MQLRSYQQVAVEEIRAAFEGGAKAVLYQLPTGGGKTAVISDLIQRVYRLDERAFALAHRRELIYQLQSTLGRFGVRAGVIMSGEEFTSARVQVASVQTLNRRLNWPLWEDKKWHPSLIITDEAHHASTVSYQQIFERFPDARLLGVTATPCRSDGKGLGNIFEALICGPQVHELVGQGYLCPPRYFCCDRVQGDHSLRTVAGDYNRKDLGDAVAETRLEGDLVAEWHRHAYGLPTVVFAVNIEHSERIVDQYRQAGVMAAHLDCSTPSNQRAEVLQRFGKGYYRVISNVGLFTEGFDSPGISCVQIARPTKSMALYRQMVGRGLRLANGKAECIVLDHAGVYQEHGNIMTPYHWSLDVSRPKEAQPDWIDASSLVGRRPVKERFVTCNGETVLVEIPYSQDYAWLEELERLHAVANQLRYKPGWVVIQLKERFPTLTREQYRVVAKTLGYHYKWADKQVAKDKQEDRQAV